MKIYTLAPNENWIVDRMVNEWVAGNSDITVKTPFKAEIIWLLADWCWNQLPLSVLQSRKVVTTVHHIVPEKFDDAAKRSFMMRDSVTDKYHCFNTRTADFISDYTKRSIEVIPYWVNTELWVPRGPTDRDRARQSLGLPVDAFIVGSFQRDTEGHDLKSPKLEKGPDLFCDAVEKIAKERDDLHVLLGGWRRQYIINRLHPQNIGLTYIERPPISKISDMYEALDLYLITARHEGGPQALLEAPAKQIPVVSTPVGIAEDVLAPESIQEDVTLARPNVQTAYDNVMMWTPQHVFPLYRGMFENL